MSQTTPNYLLFSDVHLGGDLVQHARPWTVSRLRQVLELDRRLGAMLEHYRSVADPQRPWKLVIAGDLVDFVGMSISPATDQQLGRPLTEDEQVHGLGSAADRAAFKLRAVADRHDLVFRRLAEFVAAGHTLVLVRGNHDVEFYFDAARAAFVGALCERVELANDAARRAFEARIEFRHWFYYAQDLLYVEHGHQYDATCSYQHVLAPVSPQDPNHISYSFSDILLRYVARPTRGLSADGHENLSMAHYAQLGFSMGLRGCGLLGLRFLGAIGRMLRSWHAHLSAAAGEIRAEHDRRMGELARRFRLDRTHVDALGALSARPITAGLYDIVRSVFLDGLLLMALAPGLLLTLYLSGVISAPQLPLAGALMAVPLYVWARRSRVLDPGSELRRGARGIAKLLPTRFVVMGHTHEPGMVSLDEQVTYVNLGAWAVDDLDGQGEKAPCTHFVIRHVGGQARAALYRWDDETGPTELGLQTAA